MQSEKSSSEFPRPVLTFMSIKEAKNWLSYYNTLTFKPYKIMKSQYNLILAKCTNNENAFIVKLRKLKNDIFQLKQFEEHTCNMYILMLKSLNQRMI